MRRAGLTAAVVMAMAALQLAVPRPGYALFDLFHHHSNPCDPCAATAPTTAYRPLFGLFRRPLFPRLGLFRRTTYYVPVATGGCSPCGVQYVQQTSYRAEVVQVPVTTYQPVVTSDPCTGCAVTTMRPVVTYVQQVRYRPVITYRPVVSASACCPTTTFYAPACCGTTTLTTSSDCCTGTLPATSSPEQPSLPQTQSPTPTPTYQQPQQQGGSSSQSGQQESYRQPMDTKGSASPQPKTTSPETDKPKLQPIPDNSSASDAPAPRLVFPNDRTASREGVRLHRAVAGKSQMRPVLQPAKSSPVPQASGFQWRPARRRVAQVRP